jgi:hypothetical protein
MADLSRHRPEPADLPKQPLQRLDTVAWIFGQKQPVLLGEIARNCGSSWSPLLKLSCTTRCGISASCSQSATFSPFGVAA